MEDKIKSSTFELIRNNNFDVYYNLNGELVVGGFNTNLYSLDDLRNDVFSIHVKLEEDENAIVDLYFLLIASPNVEFHKTVNEIIRKYLSYTDFDNSKFNAKKVSTSPLVLKLEEYCKIVNSRPLDVELFLESGYGYTSISEHSCLLEDVHYLVFKI